MEDPKQVSKRYEHDNTELNNRKINAVVSGSAKTKKKSEIRKAADIFISEDVHNLKNYLLMDVILPAVKRGIMGALDMILNGGKVGNYYNDNNSRTPKVSYRNYYDEPRDDRRYGGQQRARTRFDYEDIIYQTRGDAEAVLQQMYEVVDRYGLVTVGDMYDMARLDQPYTSNKYGWTRLNNVEVVRSGNGYTLRLPRALPLD